MSDLFNTDTARLTILRRIKAIYKAATDVDPAPMGSKFYGVKFSIVEIGPLGAPNATKHTAIGIVAGKEKKDDLYPLREAKFTVDIEFRLTVNRGDQDPAVMAETMLGVVQQIMYDDPTLGDTVLMIKEHGSEIDLTTYADRTVEGSVKFEVLYRHSYNNVYSTDPTA